MLPNLDEQRASHREAMAQAAAARAAGYRRARLGFKLLCAPVIFGVAFVIYQCGYAVGWMDALATVTIR